jgi:signal transduction histidine kinase
MDASLPLTHGTGEPAHGATPIRESLLFRIGVALVALISLMTAALFLSIEYFVGLQYRTLHQERLARQAEEIQHFIAREIGQMEGLARFVAGDSDLVHSAAYHLLRGENKALQTDADRIAETFRLESVSVWDGDRLVVDARSGRRGLRRAEAIPADVASPRAAALWIDGNIWIVAGAPLALSGDRRALVQLARPLSPLLKGTQLFDPDTRIVPAHPDSALAEDAIRLEFPGMAADQRLALDVRVADTVGVAMAKTKQLLAISLVVTAALLLVALTAFLERELRPLRILTRLASAVGRGEFPQRLEESGRGEVGRLVRAFNQMVVDVGRLYEVEQRLRHEEQLSAIGKLATKVAHDINNPLTVINTLVRLELKRLPAGDPARADAELLLHHCNRCINIVENLLRFGRPLKLKLQAMELGALCAQVVERIRHRLPAARLRLRGGGPLWVRADPYQLEQMLDNLIDNAWEAGGGEEVTLEYGEDGGRVFLAVCDRGPGFSRAALDHLFEPFFTTKNEGTGLGLASCLAIARAHGGDIQVSCPDLGRVTVWLARDGVREAAAA